MCVINSFFGIPLQTAVKWIGIVKLVITLILAIICIVGQTQVPCMDDEGNFLDGGSIECVGPYIRQVFFLPKTTFMRVLQNQAPIDYDDENYDHSVWSPAEGKKHPSSEAN